MAMYATPHNGNYEIWNYQEGTPLNSLATKRYFYLYELYWMNGQSLTLSLHDSVSGLWTKWNDFMKFSLEELRNALEVHRGILFNEIVLESDHPTYEENLSAMRIAGSILESKGFTLNYYYGGNKSIHAHCFLDMKSFDTVDDAVGKKIAEIFKSKNVFIKKFMLWLREKMVTSWGTNAVVLDEQLVRCSHLIRSEGSRNEKGHKTWIGTNHKDLSFVPYIVNESNGIMPKIEKPKLSIPHDMNGILEEFLHETQTKKRKASNVRKEKSLTFWMQEDKQELKPCVKYILNADFSTINDGYARSVFILANELRKIHGNERAFEMLLDWNLKAGNNVREEDIRYKCMDNKEYNLSHDYIHSFLSQIGIDASEVCKCDL